MANLTEGGWRVDTCPSCPAPIVWAVTPTHRPQPVDAEPAGGGNIRLEARGTGRPPLARVIGPMLRFGRTDLRKPHHATCSNPPRRNRRKATP